MYAHMSISYSEDRVYTYVRTYCTCIHTWTYTYRPCRQLYTHAHTTTDTQPCTLPHAPCGSRVCVPALGGAGEGEELRKGPMARNTELAVEAIRVNTVHTVCTYVHIHMSIVIARAIGTYKYVHTVHPFIAAWHTYSTCTHIGWMVGWLN